MTSLDLDYVRSHFPPVANGWAYLENAGGSYLPRQVIERVNGYMHECQNQPHAHFGPGARAAGMLSEAKAAAACLTGAEEDEIVIGPSTTMNVHVLAHALRGGFSPGDEVIVTNQDHEANIGAWRRLEEFGLVIREWRIDPLSGELDLQALEEILGPRSRLLCFAQVSNIVGTVNPVAEITALAHRAGAKVCVDGVAYAAHGLIDVKAWDVDFYLFSTYKVYGTHLAVLYCKRDHQAGLANQYHYFHADKGITQLNPGGLSYAAASGLGGITVYFEDLYRHHFGRSANDPRSALRAVFALIAAHEETLAGPLLAYLSAKPGIRLIGRAEPDRRSRVPTISFLVQDRPSNEIAEAVAAERLAIAAGHFYGRRCVEALGVRDPDDGVVRVSMVHYNTPDEVERLIAALDKTL